MNTEVQEARERLNEAQRKYQEEFDVLTATSGEAEGIRRLDELSRAMAVADRNLSAALTRAKAPAMPALTKDTSRDYRVAWLTAEVAKYEAQLANTRAVLINEKMMPDLNGDHAVMFSEYDELQNTVLSASLAEKWAKLKCLLPDSAAIIDGVFEETDDPSEVLKELELYPLPVLEWILNGLDNWSQTSGRSLSPTTIINDILHSLQEIALNTSGVRIEPSLSLMQHYGRVWEPREAGAGVAAQNRRIIAAWAILERIWGGPLLIQGGRRMRWTSFVKTLPEEEHRRVVLAVGAGLRETRLMTQGVKDGHELFEIREHLIEAIDWLVQVRSVLDEHWPA